MVLKSSFCFKSTTSLSLLSSIVIKIVFFFSPKTERHKVLLRAVVLKYGQFGDRVPARYFESYSTPFLNGDPKNLTRY